MSRHVNWGKNSFKEGILRAFSIQLAHRSLNHLHRTKCWLEVWFEAFEPRHIRVKWLLRDSCCGPSCCIQRSTNVCRWKLRQTKSIKKPIIETSELPCCKTSIFFSFPRPPRAEGCRDVPRRILRNVGRWTRCSFAHSVLKLAGQVRRSSIPQSGVPWQASHNLLRGTM